MCGKLAVYLRICGHDAAYALDREAAGDGDLVRLARAEDRTVVTRDRALADRADDAVLLGDRDLTAKLRELRTAGVPLSLPPEPERCGRCNGSLTSVSPATDTPSYAPDPDETDVWSCKRCGQYFWRGSHWADVRETLEAL